MWSYPGGSQAYVSGLSFTSVCGPYVVCIRVIGLLYVGRFWVVVVRIGAVCGPYVGRM